jgi:hypothetical protein
MFCTVENDYVIKLSQWIYFQESKLPMLLKFTATRIVMFCGIPLREKHNIMTKLTQYCDSFEEIKIISLVVSSYSLI